MTAVCCRHHRREVITLAGGVNGIDYLDLAPTGPPQRSLLVRLLGPAAGITAGQVSITGGERITGIGVDWVQPADTLPAAEAALAAGLDHPDHVLVVRTTRAGDYSTYTLHITAGEDSFDPVLASVDFSFKLDCEAKLDCRDTCTCAPRRDLPPAIDYLAKDYASLRRMLLDRLSLLAPDWRERNPADLGVMLVELLAYEGDRLSYRQDAVATEAYLATARSRISLRRHARLMDYDLHEGCSARVLLRCTATGVGAILPAHTPVYSRTAGLVDTLSADQQTIAVAAGATVFETVEDTVLRTDHDQFTFYTWGDDDCCLPVGSTSATLRGEHPHLRPGDLLILAEVCSPSTGTPEDRDPAHVWPVRLTAVGDGADRWGGLPDKPKPDASVKVTEITWDFADRLPFSLCLSAPAAVGRPVSVAWGNIVIADHGRTIMPTVGTPWVTVPGPHLFYPRTGAPCASDQPAAPVPARCRPRLPDRPLTRSVAVTAPELDRAPAVQAVLDELRAAKPAAALRTWLWSHGVEFTGAPELRGAADDWSLSDGATVLRIRLEANGDLVLLGRALPACRLTAATPRSAHPAITLHADGLAWQPRRDLLASGLDDRDFVVETEHDGTTHLRLHQPKEGTAFVAEYRIGNGVAGNVGAGTLVHIAANGAARAVTNPLPAAGGIEPETAEETRRDAPQAFRVQQRAVTPADWQEVAARNPTVQRAAATWRWTGSWHTVFLTVDRAGGGDVDTAYEHDLRRDLEKYRLAGYDLEIDRPHYVPLEIALHVCVEHASLRDTVRRDVRTAVAALFDPDRLTFAQPVYLSPILAAAQAVPGVASVTVGIFRRQQDTAVSSLDTGVLPMGRLEIARLDNDPSFPEHGVLTVTVGGGR